MERIILIGGIQYSGKSTLVNGLMSKFPDRYIELGLDIIYDRVTTEPRLFFEYLGKFCPDLCRVVGVEPGKVSGNDLDIKMRQLTAIAERQQPQSSIFIFQQVANAYITHAMANAGDRIPIHEAVFYDPQTRINFYEGTVEMADLIGVHLDFRATKKQMIYLDLGLHVSLERWKVDTRARKIHSEESIDMMYNMQMVPSNTEMPNLECTVLTSTKQVDEFLRQAA